MTALSPHTPLWHECFATHTLLSRHGVCLCCRCREENKRNRGDLVRIRELQCRETVVIFTLTGRNREGIDANMPWTSQGDHRQFCNVHVRYTMLIIAWTIKESIKGVVVVGGGGGVVPDSWNPTAPPPPPWVIARLGQYRELAKCSCLLRHKFYRDDVTEHTMCNSGQVTAYMYVPDTVFSKAIRPTHSFPYISTSSVWINRLISCGKKTP